MRIRFKHRRGLSEVISSVILTAVVLTVGGSVWYYAQSASTVMTNNYINETFTTMKDVTERFIVEHVDNKSDGTTLYVWVYNYGDVDIIADTYINATRAYNSTLGTSISSASLVRIAVSFQKVPLASRDQVAIKIHSRRQNNAFYTYYVP